MRSNIIGVRADILIASSVVGRKESEGPLGGLFDICDTTDRFGKRTWEASESEMQRIALTSALQRSALSEREIDALLAGDLLNQCVGSAYGLADFDIPYFGLYGACSTAIEAIMLASLLVSGTEMRKCAAVTSSHFCSAEQQYRTPLEYGGQRSPTAQWTVTGSGAFIIGRCTEGGDTGAMARVLDVMPGIVIDKGVNDASNMGAAMAPAAIDTLTRYFDASGCVPSDFDAIFTGDLGREGSKILQEFMRVEGYDLADRHEDCGILIFDADVQDVHSGGSGCGCSAVVLASYILPRIRSGEYKNVLVVGTGAMMSPAKLRQGASIPAIAHLIHLGRAE